MKSMVQNATFIHHRHSLTGLHMLVPIFWAKYASSVSIYIYKFTLYICYMYNYAA